jgi:dihydroorotase
MNLLIKQARVADPLSPFNGHISDIYIRNGIIASVSASISEKADEVIAIEGMHVSPGWVDVFSNFADPGYEYKETVESGIAAAAAGGFTDVFVIPNTKPVIQNKASVQYLLQKSRGLPVNIHPIGAATQQAEGKELAEMYDMHDSGAIAFGDGLNCIQSAGLLLKALQYVKAFNGVIIQLPDDKSINPHGLMNEGIPSTRLGLPGKPAMAEEMIVARDIELARYTQSAIHFTGISTAQSLNLINNARKEGLQVSCSVSPAHLYFSDEDIAGYNTLLKTNPPLRSATERDLLRKAIKNGEIDCLASHHLPHESDSKVVEFEYAKTGMIALETAFAVLCSTVTGLSADRMIELLSINPRKIFGLPQATILEGNEAKLSLFDPGKKWKLNSGDIRSRSRNTAFTGIELTGKPLGIIQNNTVVLN